MSLRTPLGRVLGRGAAGEGPGHWWVQRLTALALLPLCTLFVVLLLRQDLHSYDSMRAWLAEPLMALLTVLLIISLAWHSKLGVQVVIEDYVHGHAAKTALLISSAFAHVAAAGAGLFAVLRLALA